MKQLSLTQAVDSLKKFLEGNVPSGTAHEVTADTAEEMARTAANHVAWATEQGIDVDIPRQSYEAVGWLSVQIESWFFNSAYDDELLEAWALTEL